MEVTKPIKVGNVWTNLISGATGESVNFEEVGTWYDGTPMDDSKADGVIYRKLPDSVGGGFVVMSDYYTNGVINVRWFGAKGDGVSDDTMAIQKALDFVPNGNQMVTTNGRVCTVVIPSGKYIVSSTLFVDRQGLQIVGEGNAVLCASSTFDPDSLTGIMALGSLGGNLKNNIVRNLTFTREGANPYDNYNGDFGSGKSYDFSLSCLGLLIDHAHYYSIENCKFIGLRLGCWLTGAYEGRFDNCHFNWSDRFLQMSSLTTRANNQIVINKCVFGNSIMNGGIVILNANSVFFTDCDIEQSYHSAVFTKHSQNISFSNTYLEMNSKFTNDPDCPPHIYLETPFITNNSDAMSSGLDGYFVVDDASRGYYSFNNCLFAIPTNTNKGFFMGANTRTSVSFTECSMRRASDSILDYFCKLSGAVQNPFLFVNCQVDPVWKLTNVLGCKIVFNNNIEDVGVFNKKTFYVDLENGDDNISNADNTPMVRIKSLQGLFCSLPKDARVQYVVNIIGNTTATTVLDATLSGGGKIRIVGEESPSFGIIRLIPPTNGSIHFQGITTSGGVVEQLPSTYNDNITYTSSGVYSFEDCTINGDAPQGVIGVGASTRGGSRTIIVKNSTLTQTSPSNNNLILAQNGVSVFLNNVVLNKRPTVADGGKLYCRNITNGFPPLRLSGALGTHSIEFQEDSVAEDITELVVDFNRLLAKLRASGYMSG